jgi:anti-anti-sigma factor
MERLKIRVTQRRFGAAVVSLRGKLDNRSAEALNRTFRHLLAQGTRDVEVDCSEIEYLSSSCIGIIITACMRAHNKHGVVSLRNLSSGMSSILQMVGFTRPKKDSMQLATTPSRLDSYVLTHSDN